MFRSLYAKILVLFLAVIMMAMALLSVLLYQRIRADKMEARLGELALQARDIAYLAAQSGPYTSSEMNRYYLWKVDQIRKDYDASVLVFGQNMDPMPIEDEAVAYDGDVKVEDVQSLLMQVFSGFEVRVRTIKADTGKAVYNVGVPYVENDSVHAVAFIHTSEQSVEASYQEILAETLQAMALVLAVGALLVLVLCQYITKPLRAMAAAADRFARGDFRERVEVSGRDEVGRLAEALNSMAADLDQLEQTRREFVANVSHELRSPLTSMQGFIQAMMDGTVPEGEQAHYLSIVLEETRRLGKLISTLLDLSHIESGQSPLALSEFDVNEMICRVLFRQEARIEERHTEVDLRFEQEKCQVEADADRIEQVLINLIDNSIKYSGDGGTLTISTRVAHGLAYVSVEDDGPGISEEDLSHIFDRFYKADKAHTTGQGTGLGLSIVKGIIEQHGQRITAVNGKEKGICFTFSLAAVKE